MSFIESVSEMPQFSFSPKAFPRRLKIQMASWKRSVLIGRLLKKPQLLVGNHHACNFFALIYLAVRNYNCDPRSL